MKLKKVLSALFSQTLLETLLQTLLVTLNFTFFRKTCKKVSKRLKFVNRKSCICNLWMFIRIFVRIIVRTKSRINRKNKKTFVMLSGMFHSLMVSCFVFQQALLCERMKKSPPFRGGLYGCKCVGDLEIVSKTKLPRVVLVFECLANIPPNTICSLATCDVVVCRYFKMVENHCSETYVDAEV